MTKKEKVQYFHGDVWHHQQVSRRTMESLMQIQERFAEQHRQDTEAQLVAYVQAFARELGHTPNAGEVIGGPYIAARMGGWDRVVEAAGLTKPGKMPEMTNRLIYKKEYRRQVKLMKQEKAANQEIAAARRQQRREETQAAAQIRAEQDLLWAQDHEEDTDEQLLDYVRQCAEELGHTPISREVPGATWIAKRFGSWPLVLTLAGLPLPQGMKPPKPKTMKAYRESRGIPSE